MKMLFLLCSLSVTSACSFAGATTITFELPDSTQLTTQYAGLTFSNAFVLNPSPNALDFPPHSGTGVVTNDPNENLGILFATTQDAVSVYYTDFYSLTMSAYDASNKLLGSVTGPSNIGSSGLLSLNLSGISSLVFSDKSGTPDQFILDDLTYTAADTGNPGDGGNPDGGNPDGGNPDVGGGVIPEPSTFVLMGSGLLGVVEMARRKIRA